MSEEKIFNTGESDIELKAKYNYDGSVLRRAQLRMTEMLVFLDKICKKNNITYFIAFGTLLGAVRHGGFIPWDDDMDVYIDDRDMRKLRKIINEGDYPYVVQDYSVDKGFVRYYNVLRDLNSEYIKDEFQHNQRKYHGIQIDLFPYEYGVIEPGKKFVAKTMGFNEKFLLGRHAFLSKAVFVGTRNCVIPILKALSLFRGRKYISLGYEGVSPGYIYRSDDVFPLKSIEFEGITVPCPNHPEQVLISDYGIDYYKLPPVGSRDHHRVLNIKFNN